MEQKKNKFLKIAKILIIAFCALTLVIFLISTALFYFFIGGFTENRTLLTARMTKNNQISVYAANNVNPQTVKKGNTNVLLQQAEFFDQINKMYEEYQDSHQPSICKIICSESHFLINEKKSKTFAYVKEFYDQEKNRAFEDIKFRLLLEEMHSIARLFPSDILNFVIELESFEHMSEIEKVAFSVKAQAFLVKFSYHLSTIKKTNIETHLAELIQLNQSCNLSNVSETEAACFELID